MISQKQLEANRINGKKGGRRFGSKNKKTIAKEKAERYYLKKILKSTKFKKLIDAHLDLAIGHYTMKPIKKGGVIVDTKVYFKSPDSKSLEYMFNRMMGKPKEQVDLNVPNKVVIKILSEEVQKAKKRIKNKKPSKQK